MRLVSLIVVIVFCNAAHAQRMVFDMSAFGITFGTMTVNRYWESDSSEVYTLHAKGYLKVLWMERSDETFYEVRYKQGKLVHSSFRQVESGVLKKWTYVRSTTEGYKVDSYRGKRTFSESPVFSVLKLYYQVPEGINKIFYEAESDFTKLIQRNEKTFEIKSSDGNRSIYKYVNDELAKMEFHISIATVYMKRVS